MIAKNYRIYRIFNNIFITRNVITDNHLLQTVAGLIGLEMVSPFFNTQLLFIKNNFYRRLY